MQPTAEQMRAVETLQGTRFLKETAARDLRIQKLFLRLRGKLRRYVLVEKLANHFNLSDKMIETIVRGL